DFEPIGWMARLAATYGRFPILHLSHSRHCEERQRRSNPYFFCRSMDCFDALAMTENSIDGPHYPSILRNSAFATFSSVERGISSTKRISRGTLKSASDLR